MLKSCGVFSLTAAELYEVRDLQKILGNELDRRRQLEAAITTLTHFDGLPRPRNFGSRVERLALLLIEVTETLRDLRERIINAAVKLTEFLIRADLTADEREVLTLRYVTGLSFREISCRTNLSIGHVFKTHRRAFKRIVVGQLQDT